VTESESVGEGVKEGACVPVSVLLLVKLRGLDIVSVKVGASVSEPVNSAVRLGERCVSDRRMLVLGETVSALVLLSVLDNMLEGVLLGVTVACVDDTSCVCETDVLRELEKEGVGDNERDFDADRLFDKVGEGERCSDLVVVSDSDLLTA
jgi:hypothetical protein